MDRIYKMLIKTGYKEGNMNFYKYHGEEGHIINQYGFHNKVIQMMIRWILWIEKGMDSKVSMVDVSRKSK